MKKIAPPFTKETAATKVQAAEDAWNSKDPERVSMAYTADSQWRNRGQFFTGRAAIVAFLKDKWKDEQYYKLKKYIYGHSQITGSLFALNMNGKIQKAANGKEHMAMNIGSLIRKA